MYYCDRCWIALEPEHELSCDDLKDELIHLFVSIPILLHPEKIEKVVAIRKLQKSLFLTFPVGFLNPNFFSQFDIYLFYLTSEI